MKLSRLRIHGFKSFVETAEFVIERGLTGVVGPNGCGKSNLVEALRWVMGESSYKSMRASGMDDVIFSGSGNRPARNFAEVMLSIDNSDRLAPAAFNDADTLEISRRILRDSGSTYRINGREVRARDVQLLFADAASGARSPAFVRQGQIGEIIAARPEARRRILEDAAGIAGLHSRRHEAELRLRAAEENLLRLEDVVTGIDGNIAALKRQARQSASYRALSADIRRNEALLMLIGLREATARRAEAEAALAQDEAAATAQALAQTTAARDQAVAAAAMPGLREAEAEAAAALRRLIHARRSLDDEEERGKARMADLARRIDELESDLARATADISDGETVLAKIDAEAATLTQSSAGDGARRAAAKAAFQTADARRVGSDAALGAAERALAELKARIAAADREIAAEQARRNRLVAEAERAARDLAALEASSVVVDTGSLSQARDARRTALAAAEARAEQARTAVAATRQSAEAARSKLAAADRAFAEIDAEIRTLHKLLAPPAGTRFAPVLDAISVTSGLEIAIAVALGDDLDAALDAAAPAHWRGLPVSERAPAPSLPAGALPLSDFATAPPQLARRLAQIGIVTRAQGEALAASLAQGQRLVSREGDFWRWDGFTTRAEAPSAAARRLAERNRLAEVEQRRTAALGALDSARREAEITQAEARTAAAAEALVLTQVREARAAADAAREALAAGERQAAERASRRAAAAAASEQIAARKDESAERLAGLVAERAAIAPVAGLETAAAQAAAAAADARAAAMQAQATVERIERDCAETARRLAALAGDRRAWVERAARALSLVETVKGRISDARSERSALEQAPDRIIVERRRVIGLIRDAEAARSAAADRLVQGETALVATDRAAREALLALSQAREAKARSEARLEAARTRFDDMLRAIADSLETTPASLPGLAGLAPGSELPAPEAIEARLAALKSERERLGGVNLRADEELALAETSRATLVAERDDLVEAIKRLRQAINSLNREGRERLLVAFEVVNGHFQRLFMTLFGGGSAELQLIDAEDPLAAGLEIMARPPGKKPQTMTLLSGGEQALTACALIFAVFLTNPSPVCVLDEVDAPLDDANVERFCDLLDEMTQATDTRFVVITHNPITMARMSRLFGVTMAERGVSQLVSVDLETAELVREAS